MRYALLLRGHIRFGFHHRDLYELVRRIVEKYDTDIYIHTWSVYSVPLSYRPVHDDNRRVTRETILEYFGELSSHIKHIIIDDDTKIIHHGLTDGKLFDSRCPKLGWKNYWYGQWRLIDYVKNTGIGYDLCINTRLDIMEFAWWRVWEQMGIKDERRKYLEFRELLDRIEIAGDRAPFRWVQLYYDHYEYGIDNYIIGSVESLYKLISRFHFHLDELNNLYRLVRVQEMAVFMENERIKIEG
jgi:hypothetical protein